MSDSGVPLTEREPADRWARRWGWAVIMLVVLVVYWPLSTFTYGLVPGDTLDCWMPWRWFIASALQNGHFPLWNPYQQMGYPMYADLQGPAWYPESIALGGTVGHTLYTLQTLFLGYVIIGGIGLMRLVRGLHTDARIAVVMGLAYALGGFFSAHEMHFYAVISGAWLPWLLSAQLRLMNRPSWRLAAEAAVFQFLLLTGGNHTFTLIGSYLLAALIGSHVVRAWYRSDRAYVRLLLTNEVLFAVLALVLACGTLYAWWEVAPFISRTSGMSYNEAAVNPFTWRAAMSYFFPYAVGHDFAWLGADPTMANGFIGLLVLLLAVLSLFRRRSLVENVIGVFGMLCTLASFGPALPVHKWLWHFLPGMDLFRFPSYYQWFTTLAAVVLAAGTLAQWESLFAKHPRVIRGVIAFSGVMVLAAIIRAWAMHAHEPPFSQGDTLAERMMGMGLMHRVLINAPMTMVALVGFWFWARSPRHRWWMLVTLVVGEMGWGTTLAQWNTAIGDYPPAALQGRIDLQPTGPIWPELTPMGKNTDGSTTLKQIWKNVQDLEGRPTHDGFNTFWLEDANTLKIQNQGLFAAMKRQPLVYLSDSLVPFRSYRPDEVIPSLDSALVVLPTGGEMPTGLRHLLSDSLEVIGFDPDGITLRTHTTHPTFLMFQQSWYPGWTATLDGHPMQLQRANIAAFGVVLPAGGHEFAFRFEKPIVPWLLGISLVTFFLVVFLLAFTRRASLSSACLRAFLLILFGAIAWSLFAHRRKAERVPRDSQALRDRIDGFGKERLPLVVNTSRFPALAPLCSGRKVETVRAESPARLEGVLRTVGTCEGPLWWLDAGLPVAPSIRAALLDRYRVDTVLTEDGLSAVLLTPDSTVRHGTLLYQSPTSDRDKALYPGDPWTAAYRVPVKTLLAKAPGFLVVNVSYASHGRPDAMLVIERKRGEHIDDYETFPLPVDGPLRTMHQAYVVCDLRDMRQGEEEMGIYVWDNSVDTLIVHDLRIRVDQGEMGHW